MIKAKLEALEANVSESARNMQARLEILKGTETAATLSNIIDELRASAATMWRAEVWAMQ